MNPQSEYAILLYYKFVKVPDAELFAQEHLAYCKELDVKGRILISDEGINGTLSGTVAQTEQYMKDLRANPLFSDIVFKIDEADAHAFKKIFVRYKKELVTFRVEDELDPNVITGEHLAPKDFYEMMQRDDVVILDGRTGYEFDLGHFRGSIRPEVDSFKEFPDWIRENMSDLKDKPILTYCTGGIRCEKLSGFMMKEGFEQVYQLDGGIVTYGKDPEVQANCLMENVMSSMSGSPYRLIIPTRISLSDVAITAVSQLTNLSIAPMMLVIFSIFAVRTVKHSTVVIVRTNAKLSRIPWAK